jgi:hypothetical protein
MASVFSGRHPWFAVPNHLISDGAFQLAKEEKLMESSKGGLFLTLTQNEWRVYAVVAARCGVKEQGHSKYISNKFMQHFTGLRRGQIDEARKGLESDDCRLFKSERADNGYGRTYWLLDAEGKPYDGATVWDEYRRAAQTTSSRKASQRRNKAASPVPDDSDDDRGTSWDTTAA